MRLRRTLLFICLSMLPALPTTPANLFLVRHAEKVTDGSKDPGLTETGRRRAESLAIVLKSAGIGRVFSTDYRRTRDTATPTARQAGVEIELYDPADLEAMAARLLDLEENALVVGHSNTTPELVKLLGGDGGTPIAEEWEYDRLYLVQTDAERVTGTVHLHVPPSTQAPSE